MLPKFINIHIHLLYIKNIILTVQGPVFSTIYNSLNYVNLGN